MSKIRVNQVETLDGLNTKDVATLIDDANTAPITTSTGTDQALSEALDDRIIDVNSIQEMLALDTTVLSEGQKVRVLSFRPPTFPATKFFGGDIFVWQPNSPKSGHEGGVIISSTVPWTSVLTDWLTGTGETDAPGNGVFVRTNELINSESSTLLPEWWGAYSDGTNPADTLAAFDAMKAYTKLSSLQTATFYCKGKYVLSDTFTLDVQGLKIKGDSTWGSRIGLDAGSAGVATITVDARLCSIDEIQVNSIAAADCVYLKNAQLFASSNMTTKFGRNGIFHQDANSVRIIGHFAESCDHRGYFIEPIGDGNANGGFIQGRAINCEIGMELAVNSAPSGASNDVMHNEIHYSVEANTVGFKQRSGNYNYLNIYSESNNRASTKGNSNANFDTDDSPNIFNIRNPDNDQNVIEGFAGGWITTGSNIYHDPCWGVERTLEIDFDVSKNIGGIAVKQVKVTNSSGGTRSSTLNVLDGAPVGYSMEIYKADNTAGITFSPPSGHTFIGDASTFGAFITSGVAILQCVKINSTEIILNRRTG